MIAGVEGLAAGRAEAVTETVVVGARRSWRGSAVIYTVVVGGAVLVAFPFLWMLLTAFKNIQESNAYPPAILPDAWRWENFQDAWNAPPSTLGRYLLNSAKIRRELGWAPEVGFEDGLRSTVAWYAEHEAWWRPLKQRLAVQEGGWGR